MKHIITICSAVLLGISVYAAPVWECDFTGSKPVYKGIKAPVFRDVQAPASGTLKLDGKKQYLEIPSKFDLSKGGTLYAIVKFEDRVVKGTTAESLDMMIFRNYDFLFGRLANTIYFNYCTEKQEWAKGFYAPYTPNGKWVQIAVVFRPVAAGYTVHFFINGKEAGTLKSKPGQKYIPSNNRPVTVGKGWGGPWFFKGEIAKIGVYTEFFDKNEIAKRYKQDSVVFSKK